MHYGLYIMSIMLIMDHNGLWTVHNPLCTVHNFGGNSWIMKIMDGLWTLWTTRTTDEGSSASKPLHKHKGHGQKYIEHYQECQRNICIEELQQIVQQIQKTTAVQQIQKPQTILSWRKNKSVLAVTWTRIPRPAFLKLETTLWMSFHAKPPYRCHSMPYMTYYMLSKMLIMMVAQCQTGCTLYSIPCGIQKLKFGSISAAWVLPPRMSYLTSWLMINQSHQCFLIQSMAAIGFQL